jgi:membrane protein implicated in regulation of membrane protease activity
VESFLGIFNGSPGEMNLGAFGALYDLSGVLLILGGLLFGVATLRAGILSRWAAGLLAVAAVLTPAAALLPLEHRSIVAVPVGIALAWLGYALWSERREQASDPVRGSGSPRVR